MSGPDNEMVVLRGGLAVSLAALQWLWDLENRGFSLSLGSRAPSCCAQLHASSPMTTGPSADTATRSCRSWRTASEPFNDDGKLTGLGRIEDGYAAQR